jgi:hypothetical protein
MAYRCTSTRPPPTHCHTFVATDPALPFPAAVPPQLVMDFLWEMILLTAPSLVPRLQRPSSIRTSHDNLRVPAPHFTGVQRSDRSPHHSLQRRLKCPFGVAEASHHSLGCAINMVSAATRVRGPLFSKGAGVRHVDRGSCSAMTILL